MNNLHRELAPISDAAWAQIEEEASRTLKRYLAARRVVDVARRAAPALAAVGTGHLHDDRGARRRHHRPPARGQAARRIARAVRAESPAIDDVERGANDSDWQPLKDAAERIAFAEDRAIFDGYAAAGIQGIRQATSNPTHARCPPTCATTRTRSPGAESTASGRRQRSLFGAAGRRCLHRVGRGQRPRLSGAGAYQAAGE